MSGKGRQKWMIQVVSAEGTVMYLRHGGVPGQGRIAAFDKRTAEINAESMVAPGLDAGDIVHVVPYDKAAE